MLLDGSKGINDDDKMLMEMLDQCDRPFVTVLTKMDRMNEAKAYLALQDILKQLKDYRLAAPMVHLTSAKTEWGVNELAASLEQMNAEFPLLGLR